ncbi:hypothetical protein QVD17_15001 [Tagetes erecta]|uniref:Plant basic secretory protein (BSP) family protein n=1 Tax=Tagetes erecta TaxID=13708 RepID=A0AAD8NS86_TARER|nr:hypothetical protein QVD17_15001 [Tagetes erecta]
MAPKPFIGYALLTFSLSFVKIFAVDYYVTNDVADTPGGIRFTNEIGIPYTKEKMGTSNDFIWSTIFQQNDPSDQKPLDSVELYITTFVDEGAIAMSWGNNKINFSSVFISEYTGDDLKYIYTGILYHEMTHAFQWDGEGRAPIGLLEGVAEYTKLKANYPQPGFAKPGEGDRWDQGYECTARFLEYCDEVSAGFVANLNKKMRFDYNVDYFEDLTGKPVDQLWNDYKAKYVH